MYSLKQIASNRKTVIQHKRRFVVFQFLTKYVYMKFRIIFSEEIEEMQE